VNIGQRTEAVIACELVERGYRVLMPFGFNHRYDLVWTVGASSFAFSARPVVCGTG
jgi:hypothetical protein